jgi:hypothetical protein
MDKTLPNKPCGCEHCQHWRWYVSRIHSILKAACSPLGEQIEVLRSLSVVVPMDDDTVLPEPVNDWVN